LAAVLLLMVTWIDTAHGEVVDMIAAVVNGRVVTTSEVDRELAQLGAPTDDASLKAEALENVIERYLIEEKAQQMGVEIAPAEVDAALKRMRDQFKLDPLQFREAIMKQGIAWDAYAAGIKSELLRVRVFSYAMGEELRLDEDRLRDYYLKNTDSFRTPPKVRFLHAAADKGSGLCGLVRKKVNEGGDFNRAVVDLLGAEPYDTGLMDETSLNEAFIAALEQTAIGSVSPVIPLPDGEHVVKVVEKVPGAVLPFEQVRNKVREHFTNEGAQELYRNWIEQQKRKANIRRMM